LHACLGALADAVLLQLPALGHGGIGQVLARFNTLAFRPRADWVRVVLQHAGTELVHYTPAELALLLLTATQAAARTGALPGPDTPIMALLPSRQAWQPGAYNGPVAWMGASSSSSSSSSLDSGAMDDSSSSTSSSTSSNKPSPRNTIIIISSSRPAGARARC
jgi:hypothetical protein